MANLFRVADEKVTSIYDLGLNMASLAEYKRVFAEADLHPLFWKVNHGDNWVSRCFGRLCKVPWLCEYFAHDFYAVFKKRANGKHQ